MTVSLCFAISLLLTPLFGHVRLSYPPPRSMSNDPRSPYPCGGDTYNMASVTQFQAGQTIEILIEEQIHHPGQPYRIALSQENEDIFDCILLNHIPQHTLNGAKALKISLTLPNVTCIGCTLQMINFYIYSNTCCELEKDCPSTSYYSCANIDIVNGDIARDQLVCQQPPKWTYRNFACNYYKKQQSNQIWKVEDSNTLSLITDTDFNVDEQCDINTLTNVDTTCNDQSMNNKNNTDIPQSTVETTKQTESTQAYTSTAAGCSTNGKLYGIKDTTQGIIVSMTIDCDEETVTINVQYDGFNNNWIGIVFSDSMFGNALVYTTGKNDNYSEGAYYYLIQSKSIDGVIYDANNDWTQVSISKNAGLRFVYKQDLDKTPWTMNTETIQFRYAFGSSLKLAQHSSYSIAPQTYQLKLTFNDQSTDSSTTSILAASTETTSGSTQSVEDKSSGTRNDFFVTFCFVIIMFSSI